MVHKMVVLNYRIFRFFLLTGILVFLAIMTACNPHTLSVDKVSDLYGTYIAKYPYAKETLILYPNGKFTQDITIYSKTEIKEDFTGKIVYFDKEQYTKSTGHWTLYQSTQYIIFDNYISIAPPFENFRKKCTTPGRSILPPRLGLFGGINIIINDDIGYEYKKVK